MGYAGGRMQTLREKLFETSRFLIGTELVSVRGSMDLRKQKWVVFDGAIFEGDENINSTGL
jgi:hypothetical protein